MDLPLLTSKHLHTLIKNEADFGVFKHSATCGVSGRAYDEINTIVSQLKYTLYMIDVLDGSDLKYELAQLTDIKHESPQVLLFKKGVCIDHANHSMITRERLRMHISI